LYIAIMRGMITVILIFLITNSCFALKPEPSRPACHTVSEKKITALSRYLNKIHQDESSSFSKDEFEHPPLIRQILKNPGLFAIQLFDHPKPGSVLLESLRLYTANAQSHYNFIFHFLYPKHVFW